MAGTDAHKELLNALMKCRNNSLDIVSTFG